MYVWQRIWQVNKEGKITYVTSHMWPIVSLVLIIWETTLPRKVIFALCAVFMIITLFHELQSIQELPDFHFYLLAEEFSDNLQSVEELVLRTFNYCVIDEVDSILIDEARTPLIISGPAEKPSDQYYKAAKIAAAFERDIHYTVRLRSTCFDW